MVTLLACLAAAHDEKTSASLVVVTEREIVWKVDVGVPALEKVVRFPAEAARLSEKQLDSVKTQIEQALLKGLAARVNDRPASLESTGLEPVYEPLAGIGEPYIARVVQTFRIAPNEEVRKLALEISLFSDLTREHSAIVTVDWAPRTKQFALFGPGRIFFTFEQLDPTFWGTAREFGRWGFARAFAPCEGILFLAALALGAGAFRAAAGYGAGQGLAMLVAVSGTVAVRSGLAGPLAVGSVAYIAVENFFLKDGRYRWATAAAFGCVQGLYFSEAVRDQLPKNPGVVPAISFTAGALGGLALAFLACVPLARWLSSGDAGLRLGAARAGSCLVLAGVAWLLWG